LSDEIPLELRRFVYRGLSKDAATRYPTCSEMLADLEAVRSHVDPESAKTAIPRSAGNDAAFRQSVDRASRQLWLPATSRIQKSFWLLGSIVAAAVLLVLPFLIPGVRDGVAGLFARHEEHIAVLPFENVGNDPANEAVSEGLMDSLSSKLTNLDTGKQSLWVVPASEVRRRKITNATAAHHELG